MRVKDYRSVRGVASDVVVELFAAGVVPNDAATVHRVCVALGLDRTHLDDAAARRRDGHGWGSIPQTSAVRFADVTPDEVEPVVRLDDVEPPNTTTPTPNPAPEPDPVAPQPGRRNPPRTPPRPERTRNGVRLLRCTGECTKWLPVDKFLARTDRPGYYTSRCLECRKVYQRARRVSVATFDALNKIGVKFELDTDSNLVGLLCAKCDQPFQPGDTAETTTGLSHAVCPTKPKRKRGK